MPLQRGQEPVAGGELQEPGREGEGGRSVRNQGRPGQLQCAVEGWRGASASQYPGKTQATWKSGTQTPRGLLGADPLVSGGLLPWLMLTFWGRTPSPLVFPS